MVHEVDLLMQMFLKLLHLALERRRLRFASIERNIVARESFLGTVSTIGSVAVALITQLC